MNNILDGYYVGFDADIAIYVVATEGAVQDLAVYIAPVPTRMTEQQARVMTYQCGIKLPEVVARAFFPKYEALTYRS